MCTYLFKKIKICCSRKFATVYEKRGASRKRGAPLCDTYYSLYSWSVLFFYRRLPELQFLLQFPTRLLPKFFAAVSRLYYYLRSYPYYVCKPSQWRQICRCTLLSPKKVEKIRVHPTKKVVNYLNKL